MKITCPTCNTVYNISSHKIPEGKKASAKCKKCGGRIVVEAKVEETTTATHKAESPAIKEAKTEVKEAEAVYKQKIAANEITEEELRLFFGESVNYYLTRWKKIKEKGGKVSWNWAAVILGIFWLFFRKMYLYAFIFTILLFTIGIIVKLLNILTIKWIVRILFLPFMGLFGNYLYMKHAEKKIIKIKNIVSDPTVQRTKIAKKGGTSYFILIAFIVLYVAVPAIHHSLKVGHEVPVSKHQRTMEDFNKAIAQNQNTAMTHYNRGLAYLRKGQYDKAISDYSKAIEINPKFAEAYSNRGYALFKKGDYDRACSDYQKACKLGNCTGLNMATESGQCKSGNINSDLLTAAKQGDTNQVIALLDKGADVNARDKYGSTALIHAASKGHTDTVRVLLNKGADVNAKSKRGGTALFGAALEGDADAVRVLLNKGADVNAKNNKGQTALMYASWYGRTDVVKVLLDKGADVNAINNDGGTALMDAKEKNHTKIIELLKQYGARKL